MSILVEVMPRQASYLTLIVGLALIFSFVTTACARNSIGNWVDSNKTMREYLNEGMSIVGYSRIYAQGQDIYSYILQKKDMVVRCTETFSGSVCEELQ